MPILPVLLGAALAQPPRYQAVVDARFAGRDSAVVDGTPTFHTIGAALRTVPGENAATFVIFIRNGTYHEKLVVQKPNVTFLGESRAGTVLTWDDAAGTPVRPGEEIQGAEHGTHGTRNSYTLRIAATDFRAERLTIENGFDFDANAAKPDTDPTKLRGTQGVAVMTYDGADRTTFVDVRLVGYQDTVFPNVGRHYFHHCEILGHVDFIFGAGQAVFDDCDIVTRDLHRPQEGNGYVVAPSTEISKPYGFLFIHSRLKRETPGVAKGSVALGRPWHPGARVTAVGSAVFVDCWMDDHIGAKGWDRMSSVDSVSGVRYWFAPEAARFLEYGSTGPGAIASPTRRVMTDGDLRTYTPARVLDGWMPTVR
ncbi:Pectinesterase [Gemmatirosa kalamazoonensis]|uniref:Pectinesterase n=1 Tax=Gemmatirosa kalamazoonensis TaxID=861299 RepID=W0REU7_9BACT|nr:pectinesterase family protein [Gemmatirosa kalamazoonensis]AHG87903.1 Pectinesterase [Gemmatirosa kalamazoonensis]